MDARTHCMTTHPATNSIFWAAKAPLLVDITLAIPPHNVPFSHQNLAFSLRKVAIQ